MRIEYAASSVREFVREVLSIAREWEASWQQRDGWERESAEIWLRGHAKRFYEPGAPLDRPKPVAEWEWYFAAQHYGMPTRFLDWTDDALVALHFAVLGGDWRSDDPPAVWIMEAASAGARRSRFTIHRTEGVGLSDSFERPAELGRRGHLARIELTRPSEIARELHRLGFALDRVFPAS